jgi:hypothetical protein
MGISGHHDVVVGDADLPGQPNMGFLTKQVKNAKAEVEKGVSEHPVLPCPI